MSDPRRARLLRAAVGTRGPVDPDDNSWPAWALTARVERVIPQLYIAAADVADGLDEAHVEEAERMQLDVAAWSVQLEHRLLAVTEILCAAGVVSVVLKGCATAHLDYPDPAERQVGDVDLLIDPADLRVARQALEVSGWTQAYGLPRHHDAFTHAVTFKAEGPCELDLHQRVAHRALGILVPSARLLEDRVPFEIAGVRIWALGDCDRLVHAAVHAIASRGPYRRLSSVADVLVLSRKLMNQAADVLDRAERWRVRPLVEAAVRSAHGQAMLPVPEPWDLAMRRSIRSRDRLVELAYLGEHRRPAIEEVAYLRHMPGWRDRLLYLYGYLRMDTGPGSGGLRQRLRYLRSRLRQRT